jgi:hypothetical protein
MNSSHHLNCTSYFVCVWSLGYYSLGVVSFGVPRLVLITPLAAVISKTLPMQSCACSMQCRPC